MDIIITMTLTVITPMTAKIVTTVMPITLATTAITATTVGVDKIICIDLSTRTI